MVLPPLMHTHNSTHTGRPRFGLAALLLVATLSIMGPALTQAAPPQRVIIKWKADSADSRTQRVGSLSTRLRNSTGVSLTPRRALGERLEVVQLDQSLNEGALDNALRVLNSQSDVEYASPDQRRRALTTTPSEQYFLASSGRTNGQWYLMNSAPAAIKAVDAWDYSNGGLSGAGVIVAVLDTGIRPEHPDLTNKLLPGRDFVDCDQTSCTGTGLTFLTANDGDGWDSDPTDPGDWISADDLARTDGYFDGCGDGDNLDQPVNSSWHGTRVAGIIGAETNNGIGIAGTGWNARILPVRVLGKCGGWDSDIIAGMYWAAGVTVNGFTNPNPAKVLNLSLGGAGNCQTDTDENGTYLANRFKAYRDAISTMTARGVTVVASAGNDSALLNVPANCSGVISVVGVRHTGTKVGFSSLGNATIAAPAGNCPNNSCTYSLHTTVNMGSTTATFNDYTDDTNYNLGTSFSAPIVSGTVALMLGVNANLTPAQIIDSLRRTATPFPATATNTCVVPTNSTPIATNEAECNCTTSTCGAGLTNALAAVLDVGGSSSSSSSSSVSTAASTSGSSGGGTLPPLTLTLLMGLAALRYRLQNKTGATAPV